MATQKVNYKKTNITYKRKYYVKKTSNTNNTKKTYNSTISNAKKSNAGNPDHCPTCGAFIGNKGKNKKSTANG